MGLSFSSNRRRNNHTTNPYYQPPPPPPPPPPQPHHLSNSPYYSDPPPFSPPPPPPPRESSFSSSAASSSSAAYPDQPNSATPYPAPRAAFQAYPLPLPPPPPQGHYCYGQYNSCSHANPMMGRFSYGQNYQAYYGNQASGWPTMRGPPVAPVQPAKKVKNDVNVHKETLKVEIDEDNPDQHLVSFVFDALYDGRDCTTQYLNVVPPFADVVFGIEIQLQIEVQSVFLYNIC